MTDELITIKELETQIESLEINKYTVGFAFDERMLLHKNYSDTHQERPERAEIIYCNLISKGLKEKLIRIPANEVDENILLETHTPLHLENIYNLQFEEIKEINKSNKKTNYKTESNLEAEEVKLIKVDKTKKRNIIDNSFRLCYDTYDNYFTPLSASVSTGTLLNCAKFLMEGKVNSAFAIIRPPGHHACQNQQRGFCFYNNVAVTTNYLMKHHNLKVAIVDWDVHHGDGTQEIFYDKNNPLFISLHRHDNGNFYPNVSGKIDEQGSGKGVGFSINIPWNTRNLFSSQSGIGDDEYVFAFDNLVIPVLKEYAPDFIIVSSGFDACENDPLGQMSLTPLGYSYMTKALMQICPKLLVALEGGYNLNSLQRGSESIIRTLLGEKQPFKNLMVDRFAEEAYSQNVTLDFYNKLNKDDLNKTFFSPANYVKEIILSVIKKNLPFWKNIDETQVQIKNRLLRKNHTETLSKFLEIIKNSTSNDKEKIDLLYWRSIFEITEDDLFSEKKKKNSIKETISDQNQTFDNASGKDKKINSFLRFNIGKLAFDEEIKQTFFNKYLKNMHKNLRTISRKMNFRLEGISSNKDLKDRRLNWQYSDGIFDVSENNLEILIQKFLNLNKFDKNDIIHKLETFYSKSEWFANKNIDLFNVDLIINFKKITLSDQNEDKKDEVKKPLKFKVIKSSKKKYDIILRLNGLKEYSLKTDLNKKNNQSANNFISGISSLITLLKELL